MLERLSADALDLIFVETGIVCSLHLVKVDLIRRLGD